MACFEIAFNKNKNMEYFLFKNLTYTVTDKENLYFLSREPKSKVSAIGTFLLEFLNADLKNIRIFRKFIFKYLFQSLACEEYSYLKGEQLYKNDPSGLDDSEIDDMLDELCKNNHFDFLSDQSDFLKQFDLPDHTGFQEKLKKASTRLEEPVVDEASESVFDYRDGFTADSYIEELSISFDKFNYFHADISFDDVVFSTDIPYSFYSNNIADILFLSVKEFKTRKNATIRQCQNCGKFFIPENLNNTKYCNNIYKNKKTCMELGKEITYKKSLKNDALLQKYRRRYMSLASNVSHYGADTAIAKFEEYKKTGTIMREKYINKTITPKEFEKWIDGTKKITL